MNRLNRTELYFEICHPEKVDKYYFVSKQLVENHDIPPPHKLISSATNTPVATVQSTHLEPIPCNQQR